MKKIYVLDHKSVILYDPTAFFNFKEHDVVIPIETFETIAQLKDGTGIINENANIISIFIDSVSKKELFNGGVPLGEGLGMLRIFLDVPKNKSIRQNIENIPGNKILNLALFLEKKYKNQKEKRGRTEIKEKENAQVILVSKDINLRLMAKAWGITAEDYLSDKIKNVDEILKEIQPLNLKDKELSKFYEKNKLKYEIPSAYNNQYFFLGKEKENGTLVRYFNGEISSVDDAKKNHHVFNIKPKNIEQIAAVDCLMDENISLVSLEGVPGSGKTLLTLACGLEKLRSGVYDKILYSRPIISVGGNKRDIGFLPGDADDKISPYMEAMYDNLDFLGEINNKSGEFIKKNLEEKKILLKPLSLIRGRTLHNTFFIIDETQNSLPHEIKTFITRIGEKSKIVIIGDTKQIDDPFLTRNSNGLVHAISNFQKESDPVYAHVSLTEDKRSYLSALASRIL